jgi:hypothetical protein
MKQCPLSNAYPIRGGSFLATGVCHCGAKPRVRNDGRITVHNKPKTKGLREHIKADHHQEMPKRMTVDQMTDWHTNQHWRYGGTNHYHEGDNRGPGSRPVGWRTGEGVRYRPE